jgi:hypothetical protein
MYIFFRGGTTNGKKYLVSAQQCLKVFSEGIVHEWQHNNLVGTTMYIFFRGGTTNSKKKIVSAQ